MSGVYYEECERSFCITDQGLAPVLATVWPSAGVLSTATADYMLIDQDIKLAIHFYSSRTGLDFRERLKLSLRKGRLKVTLDQKKIVPEHKYEQRITTTRRKKEALAVINDFGPVVAAFLKERARLKYFSGENWVKIGIDQTVPFDPKNTGCHGDVVYHLEFEASDQEVLEGMLRSKWFASTVGRHVRPMDILDTKWVLASEYCAQPTSLSFRNTAEVMNYWEDVIRKVAPAKIPLDGLTEGAPWPGLG